MKAWQHDETGRITEAPESPGPRWHEVPYAAAAMATPEDIDRLQREAYAEGRKDERERCAEICASMVDGAEERRAHVQSNMMDGDIADQLRSLKHHQTVCMWNTALRKAVKAIRSNE